MILEKKQKHHTSFSITAMRFPWFDVSIWFSRVVCHIIQWSKLSETYLHRAKKTAKFSIICIQIKNIFCKCNLLVHKIEKGLSRIISKKSSSFKLSVNLVRNHQQTLFPQNLQENNYKRKQNTDLKQLQST